MIDATIAFAWFVGRRGRGALHSFPEGPMP
jgi:hypothetical protein